MTEQWLKDPHYLMNKTDSSKDPFPLHSGNSQPPQIGKENLPPLASLGFANSRRLNIWPYLEGITSVLGSSSVTLGPRCLTQSTGCIYTAVPLAGGSPGTRRVQ